MAKLSIAYLESLTIKDIYSLAKEHKIAYYSKLTKRELIFALLKSNAEKEGFFFMEGVLEIIPHE
ncbi:transcription termination factor Rho, partial [Escherichia coli]|nr:transcription termination factor Rho [Escherichia coli]